ncbi:3-hydroxyacyl-CoA dehydrogenase NAD-binding domain-containing protein [Aeromicrobium wangtongii]|uniref:3-hydroxyacyl-CoA dehydrogenase NAD-binding domain-containing protein n=1 Tax=Aeromicrobium wangtongii TaxID=2969247 RepID=A0ABY5MAG1_9ACTN|nr:3-hydroxyacyl-CoA dehydrogenase NAD-binding domain-containing protein [Aeromicrobium wangtongii]MCD9199196.1 3-hydroxyacyl-CoA dehydrogenase NAD-binding domain-containing protein [Aeromicrobium wangtongii]UUP12776.1 3-hydroxyacyl-CoA dehydrogenase NAD-binding domain-containing protein [Aeromicrobium wangtongii]
MQEIVDRLTHSDPAADVVRRLLLPYLNHAATMYESGYATSDDIDAAMRFGCGYPVGPLALADAIGAQALVTGLDKLYAETGDEVHQPASVLTTQAADGTTFASAAAGDVPVPQLRHEISRVGVVGTGTMASGIVEVFAKAGYDVTVIGRSDDKIAGVVAAITKSLDKAVSRGKLDEDGKATVLARLTGATERSALADADLVVEAIAEDLDVKLELFADLDAIAKPGAILATTTSSLSINACAAATKRPQDVIGMHFFNPAAVMKLVEVVTADETSEEVDETVRALCLAIGKHPVSCGDRAGFIVNALLFPYLNDAIKLSEAGVASVEEIDEALRSTQLPMGPFQLLDVVGNDVSLAIQRSLVSTFGHAGWQPARTLEQKVAEGKLGRKTGEGFHTY